MLNDRKKKKEYAQKKIIRRKETKRMGEIVNMEKTDYMADTTITTKTI